MTICAVYVRISTDEDLQRWSIPAQTGELKKLSERRGWTVYNVYADTMSGSCSSRPGLDALRDDMAAGKFSAVLVVDQDRLSRMDPIDWELLKKEIRDAGVWIITPSQEVDLSDEDSELVSDVFNLFARHQRRKIKKAMCRGRAEAARRGRWLGKAPYGRVLREDGSLDLNPETAPVVRKIFEMYEKGLGAKRIAESLKPVPAPDSPQWDHVAVLRVLTNRVHRGDLIRTENGQVIEIEGIFSPTVPVNLFDRCIEILRRKREASRWIKSGKVTSLGAGIVSCGECGKLFNVVCVHSKHNEKMYRYYYYRHRLRAREKMPEGNCRAYHRVDEVDACLVKCIKAVCSSAQGTGIIMGQAVGRVAGLAEAGKRMETLQKARKSLEGKLKKLLKLYLETDWDGNMLDEQKNKILKMLDANQRDQDEAEALLSSLPEEVECTDIVPEYLAALSRMDVEMTRMEQAGLVQALFAGVEISAKGELRVFARLPVKKTLINAVLGNPIPEEKGLLKGIDKGI